MGELSPDQHYGANFLAERRVAYLADAPGVGKTAQYIRAADRVCADTITVISPPILRSKLQGELDLWSLWGHKTAIIETEKDDIPESGYVAISYALAARKVVAKKLLKRKRGVLIFDEAHALKEWNSQRSKALLSSTGLIHNSTHTWFASGTPVPNHAGELFLFAKVSGLWRGTYDQWVQKFCVVRRDKYAEKIIGSKDIAELRALISPLWLRRTEVEGRPSLTLDTVSVAAPTSLDPFASLSDEERATLMDAISSSEWDLSELQYVATIRRILGLVKAKPTVELARTEMDAGHKVLVFGFHLEALKVVYDGLAGFNARLINGSTNARNDAAAIDAFQNDTECKCLVLNSVSAGEGLNLTAATRVLLFEPSWTPKDNQQPIARAWRRGQTRPVHASYVSLAGSLDDAISATLMRKSRDIASLID